MIDENKNIIIEAYKMKTIKGYVNEGKVLLGLYHCSKGLSKHCNSCPYNFKGCCTRLARDCACYISELERRLAEYEKNKE